MDEKAIYAYELEYNSSACIVYCGDGDRPKNLYRELLKRQNAKKEALYWLMNRSRKYAKRYCFMPRALNFDTHAIDHYLWELIFNSEDGQDLYDEVDVLYDELCSADKEKWKKRLDLMEYLFFDK